MRAASLGLALAVVACGSRSQLPDLGNGGGSAGAGASGGSVVTGGSGGGGFGGTAGFGGAAGFGGTAGFGGAAGFGGMDECAGFFQVGGVLEVQHSAKDVDRLPELVYSSDGGDQLSVAFEREPVESPSVFRQVGYATFLPWDNWPNGGEIAPVHDAFASPQLSPKFRAGAGFGDHLSLLVAHDTGGSAFPSFAPNVAANKSDAGPTVTLLGSTPAFAARGAEGRHLVGTRDASLYAQVVKLAGGSIVVQTSVLGCASFGAVADAVPFGDGWVVALANGSNAPKTGCGLQDPEPPTRLDLVRVGPDATITYLTSVDAGAPLMQIAAAAHPSGAYVVYRVASGGAVAPIRWLRIDASSANLTGPLDLSGPGDFPLEFDAAALGERLVVAWGNDPAGNPPDLVLSLLDPEGPLLASYAFEPQFFGELSLIGAPGGQSLVVAWQGPSSGSAPQSSIHLARFDCFGAL